MNGIATLAEAVLKLSVDGTKLASGLADAEAKTKEKLDRLRTTLDGVRNVAAIGFGLGVAALTSFAKSAEEAEGTVKRLQATLKGIGPTVGITADEVQRFAEGLMRASDFDDEDIIDGFRKIASATGSGKDGMLAMEAATNLANQSGASLEQTSQALLMAYNGQTRGLKSLGITLAEGVKGHDALVAVMAKVRGANEATADSTERSMRRMQVEWGNAKENLGKSLLPMMTALANKVTDVASHFNNLSADQQSAYGHMLLYGTAILGVVSVGAQLTKWVIDFRVGLLALKGAQDASNLAGMASKGWLSAMPGWINPATLAVLALAAAWVKAYKDMEWYRQALGSNAGGDGTGGPFIKTERGLQSVREISDDTGMSSFDYGGAYVGGLFLKSLPVVGALEGLGLTDVMKPFRDMKAAAQSAEDANRTIERMKATPKGGNYRDQASSVKQQLAGLI